VLDDLSKGIARERFGSGSGGARVADVRQNPTTTFDAPPRRRAYPPRASRRRGTWSSDHRTQRTDGSGPKIDGEEEVDPRTQRQHPTSILVCLPVGQLTIPRSSRRRSPEAPALARESPHAWGRKALLAQGIPANPRSARKRQDRVGCTNSVVHSNSTICGGIVFVHPTARDPPVGQCRQALLVRGAVLDPRHLVGRAELAPAQAVVAVEHESRVRRAFPYPSKLTVAFRRGSASTVFVESHAPAAPEDPIIAFHQRGERRPGRLVQSFDGVLRHGGGA
jgi:hypothetical protein